MKLTVNLLVTLVLMVALLFGVGLLGGVGTVELGLWFVLLVVALAAVTWRTKQGTSS